MRRQNHLRAMQQPSPPPCEPGLIYTVQPEDTLPDLEQRLGVRVQDILDANPQISGSEDISAGQQICIPFVEPDCPSGMFVEVAEGDTLQSIAEEFDVTSEELIELNPQLANPNVLLPGFILCLPEEESSSQRRRQRVQSTGYQYRYRDASWQFGMSTFRANPHQ